MKEEKLLKTDLIEKVEFAAGCLLFLGVYNLAIGFLAKFEIWNPFETPSGFSMIQIIGGAFFILSYVIITKLTNWLAFVFLILSLIIWGVDTLFLVHVAMTIVGAIKTAAFLSNFELSDFIPLGIALYVHYFFLKSLTNGVIGMYKVIRENDSTKKKSFIRGFTVEQLQVLEKCQKTIERNGYRLTKCKPSKLIVDDPFGGQEVFLSLKQLEEYISGIREMKLQRYLAIYKRPLELLEEATIDAWNRIFYKKYQYRHTHKHRSVYTYPAIPNADAKCALFGPDELIIGFVDGTLLGSGKKGFIITTSHVYRFSDEKTYLQFSFCKINPNSVEVIIKESGRDKTQLVYLSLEFHGKKHDFKSLSCLSSFIKEIALMHNPNNKFQEIPNDKRPEIKIKKVPCAKCGAEILPSTAQRTNGLCMPCA